MNSGRHEKLVSGTYTKSFIKLKFYKNIYYILGGKNHEKEKFQRFYTY